MKKEKKKKSILIVEDELSLQKVLTEKLSHEGYLIIQASNGQEGLDSALREKPDLILLDILMPVMDGSAMLEKLRADEWGKKAKVIIITNLADKETDNETKKYGVNDFLIKSECKIIDIVKKINEILRN